MACIKYLITRTKYKVEPVYNLTKIEITDDTKIANSIFVEFRRRNNAICGYFIGAKGTYLEYGKTKYRTNEDFYKLQVLLEKQKIKKALSNFKKQTE